MYRLSGDMNAIHVVGSPAMFQCSQPILHGLCTLSYVVHGVQCRYLYRGDSAFAGAGVGGSTIEFEH